ncbi:PDZ domain-containing protein [Niabella defluvii]|nr:PDZ domain-containing protein [Niabella sp. I65]
MLRIGQILNSLNKWGFIESSCIMETGDSGGPLFDLEGKLIGLHSRIDKPEGANYEVPVDSYRKYFTALKLVKNYDSLPQQSDPVLGNERSSAHHSQRFKATAPVVLAKVKSRIEGAVVAIYGSRDTIAGTVFQLKNGRQIIISKSSEVGDTVFIDVNGRFIPLNILRRDKRKDLVALSSSYRFLQPVMINQLKPVRGGDSGWTGRFLYSVLPDGTLKSSVAGLIVKDLPNRFSSGGFDAFLQERNGCPTITQTDAGGVAEKAGLKTGDCIFQINNIPVNGAKDFNREMMKYYPGDSIRFSVKRQEDTLNAGLVLVPRMLREQPHPMNHFKGGKSIRRDGFQHVILHDARLRSYECGSPLFNLEGNLTGINIARFSHTTTLALELSELLDFIETIGL